MDCVLFVTFDAHRIITSHCVAGCVKTGGVSSCGILDVAARFCAGDGSIAALVGGLVGL